MLNNEANRTNQCTFWFIKIAAFFILLLAAFFVMFTHKTFAVSMSPTPVRGVEVPIVIYDDLNSWISATPCISTNKQPTSPKLVQWIALAGSPAITDFTVRYGQQSVDLGYHSAGVTCYNTRGLRTYYQILGASSVPAGSSINPVGQNNALDWRTNYSPGQYRHDATGFTFYPAGGFTVSTTYTITLKVKVYNEWNGTGIICAQPDAARAGLPYDRSSWSQCPTEDIPVSFRVTVDRKPNLNITTDCVNRRFTVTSSDQDGGPYKVAYGIDSRPLIILPNNFSANPLTVTIPMADKNQHTIKAFTAGKDPSGGAGWWTLKEAVYGPCQPPPTVTCSLINPPDSLEPQSRNVSLKILLTAQNAPTNSINSTNNPLTVRITQGSVLFNATVPYQQSPFGNNPNTSTTDPIVINLPTSITYNDVNISANMPGPVGVGGAQTWYLRNTSCGRIPVREKPYLSFFGGDVCSGGSVKTFVRPDFAGSGSQLATFAAGVITEYASAKLRSAPNYPYRYDGLSFANNTNPPGNFANGICSVDTSIFSPPITARDRDLFAPGSGVYKRDGNLIINTPITITGRKTIYVTGNLIIKANITYAPYNSIADIPSVTFIVGDGPTANNNNIYIQNNVTQLDGTYMTRRTIFTCALADNLNPNNSLTVNTPSGGRLFNNCGQQLTINGALYAENIRWHRSQNSLRNAVLGEHPYAGGVYPKAAEVVIDGPERYLAPPSNNYDVDTIISLPPVL